MIRRKVHRVFKPGSINRLTFKEEDLRAPDQGEVTVNVKAVGLNFADIAVVKGLYSATPKEPFIPGLEFAGDVIDPGATDLKAGQKVMGVTRFGAYTDHLNIDSRYISSLPESWNYQDGAAFQVQVLTAYYALIPLGAMSEGDKVLIHSAAGGVGIWANRIAKKKGGYTIGTVGRESKFDLLKKENYDNYLVRGKDFRASYLQKMGDSRPDLVLECIGGKVFMDSYKLMERMGRLITYGSAHFITNSSSVNYISLLCKYFQRPKLDPMKMTTSNKSVMGFNLIWLFDKAHLYRHYMDEILDLNLGKPIIGHTFSFKDARKALKYFQTGKTTGKVVLEI